MGNQGGMKMQRQGMVTTEKELFKLANELKHERLKSETTGLKYDETQKHQLNIINKSDCSDTWEFEK